MSWVITGSQKVNWDPSLITTALWLDAADASTITTVSGAASQWNDKSGGGINFAQSSSTLRPATGSESLNSKNVITFDGTNDNMTAGNVLNAVWTGSAFNIFFAAKNNNVNSSNGLILGKNSSSPLDLRQFASYIRTNRSQLATFYTPDTFNLTVVDGSTNISNSQWVICSQAYTNTGSGSANTTTRVAMTVNGAVETPVVTFSIGNLGTIQSASGLLSIGASVADGTQNTGNLNGAIAEIVVTSSVLSTLNRQKTEGYLAHKWGLTANLPSDHPYKVNPPAP
jgi:hypothetical protein